MNRKSLLLDCSYDRELGSLGGSYFFSTKNKYPLSHFRVKICDAQNLFRLYGLLIEIPKLFLRSIYISTHRLLKPHSLKLCVVSSQRLIVLLCVANNRFSDIRYILGGFYSALIDEGVSWIVSVRKFANIHGLYQDLCRAWRSYIMGCSLGQGGIL